MSLPVGYWVLFAIGALGELGPFTAGDPRQRRGVYLSASTSMAILLVWGLWPAIVAQAVACAAVTFRSRLRPKAASFLLARSTAATAAASVVLSTFGVGTLRRPLGIDPSALPPVTLAIVAWLVVYHGPVVVGQRWLKHESWPTILRGRLGAEVLASAALLFVAPVVVAEPRGWTFALLVLPLVALNQLSGIVERQAASLRTDRTTGLLNQRGLADAADELGRPRRGVRGRYAALLVRLRSLRDLDDAFGRPIVDAVLAGVAKRLVGALPKDTVVGRPDSDDLVVLVSGSGQAEADNDDPVRASVAMIGRAVSEPVLVDGLPYDADCAIGVARFPEDAEDLPGLLRRADAALRYGRVTEDGMSVLPPPRREETSRRLGLLSDLRAALARQAGAGTIDFVYQPQVWLDSGAVVAAEALLRWRHPQRGHVSPDDLFQIAEPTPLMHELTLLAFETVTRQLRHWNDAGLRLRAAVNVSVRDLHQGRFVADLETVIDRAGVAPDQVVVEITEREVISDPDQVRRTTVSLAAAGIQVAVDDFGSGFASLQYVRMLRLHQLKIDKELVQSMTESVEDRALVKSLIELSSALGLTVVAEGVENKVVHQMLVDLGCPMGQGWFYGRPTSAARLAQSLGVILPGGAQHTGERDLGLEDNVERRLA